MKRNIIETVLGAIVLTVAGIFLLYSTTATGAGHVDGYKINGQFNEIGALKKGNDVRIGGVKIGTVYAIDLDPQTYRAIVTMSIRPDIQIPIDTAARISSESLMGGSFVALDIGGEDAVLARNGTISYTQDAQNLEQLLGKFIFSMDAKDGDKSSSSDAPASLPQM